MPTHHRGIKAKDWIEGEAMEDLIEDENVENECFMIGPNGEKRPTDSLASIVWAMEIGAGLREEEYVDGKKPPPKKRVRIV